MPRCTCESTISPSALRFVRAYKPRFGKLVMKFLEEKAGGDQNLQIQDVQQCIAMAYDVLLADTVDRIELPPPDATTMQTAIEDYRAGLQQTIGEILDELS